MRKIFLIMALATSVVITLAVAGENNVPYPENYRQWQHVKSMLIQPGHPLENPFQGIHHVYANDKAMNGMNDGKYSDGSVLAFDLLEYVEKDNAIQEGKRKLLGVMHKDSVKYGKTGGWGFEGFAGDSKTERLTNDGGQSCFGCHLPQKEAGYVFSKFRP